MEQALIHPRGQQNMEGRLQTGGMHLRRKRECHQKERLATLLRLSRKEKSLNGDYPTE